MMSRPGSFLAGFHSLALSITMPNVRRRHCAIFPQATSDAIGVQLPHALILHNGTTFREIAIFAR